MRGAWNGKLPGWCMAGVLLLAGSLAGAAEIRDHAGLFSAEARKSALARLEQIEREYNTPTIIETIESLNGEPIDRLTIEHAKRSGIHGVYTLISRKETKIETVSSNSFLGHGRARQIDRAFVDGFEGGRNLDAGLLLGVKAIGKAVSDAGGVGVAQGLVPRNNRGMAAPHRGVAPAQREGGGGLSALFLLGAVVLGIVLISRALARRASYGGMGGQPMNGGPGMGPGMGPGYGGGGGYGYGGGRPGGFWSSVFGGIGGAMAGNWIYDQMSGRHHQADPYQQSGTFLPPESNQPADDNWGGDTGGMDWGGGGGGDLGGGDWGGGGGGDWGGAGGGDWG